ncbi:MAG: DUF4421 family protein [Cytophagaceae bacterium]
MAENKDSTIANPSEDYVYNSRNQITLSIIGFRYFNGLYYLAEQNISYRPTIPIILGVGFSHKILNVNVGIIGLDVDRRREKSNHNYQFQMSAFLSRFGLDFIWAKNEGYYVGNQKAYHLFNNKTDSAVFKDMHISRLSINAVVILSKKFNLQTTFGKSRIANSTNKGWFLNMGFASMHIKNDTGPVIPIQLEPSLQNSFLLDQGYAYSMAVLPGYAIHKVWAGKFYASFAPSLGPSFQWIDLREVNQQLEGHSNISAKMVLRAGAGYHTKHWVFGASVMWDSERFYLGENTALLNNIGKVMLKVGYKIPVPKWAKKYSGTLDTVEDKLKQYEHNTFGN